MNIKIKIKIKKFLFFSCQEEKKIFSPLIKNMTTDNSASGKQIVGTVLLFSFLMFCVQKILAGKDLLEGFINYPRGIRVDTVNSANGRAVFGNNQKALSVPVLNVKGRYQSPLSPRFSSTGYGANITYNLPNVSNLAVEPNNPLQLTPSQYAAVVESRGIVENPALGAPAAPGAPGFISKETFKYPKKSASGSYAALQKNKALSGRENSAGLPLQNMNNTTSSGSAVPLVMDRFIITNMKSNKYALGDFIRGDLPIVPVLPNADPNSCTWFRPSVNPSIDLNPGALAVLGGAFNDSARQTAQLKMQSNSGALNTFAGVQFEPPADTSVGQQLIANTAMAAQRASSSLQGSPNGDVGISSPAANQAFTTTFP